MTENLTTPAPSSPLVTLSPNDSLWLNMDSAENLMIIESVIWFDEPLDLDAVRETLRERLVARFPVFSWRPDLAEGRGADHWVADENFSIDRHLTQVFLDQGDPHTMVQDFLSAQMSQPLPMDRPLWHAYVLQGQGLSALVSRYHHAIADGTALVRVMLEMTTATPEGDPAAEHDIVDREPLTLPVRGRLAEEPVPGARRHPTLGSLAFRRANQLVTVPLAVGSSVVKPVATLAKSIDRRLGTGVLTQVAAQTLATADVVDKLLVGTAPDALPFGRPESAKLADWASPIPLTDIKAIARSEGATVNDVMLALLSGGLRRYILARGEDPVDVVTMIPVNLRPLDAPLPTHLGNKFALVTLSLPLGEETSTERLRQAKSRMDVVKAGPESLLTFGLAHAIGGLGAVTPRVSRGLTAFFSDKAFGVTTNVPGPTTTRYFAGKRITGMLGWVPGASDQTLGVCIFSYNGQISVGFKADAAVLPDVGNLVSHFEAELAEMLAAVTPPVEASSEASESAPTKAGLTTAS